MGSSRLQFAVIITVLFCFLGCTHPDGTAHFKIAQLLVRDAPITVKLLWKETVIYDQQLDFGSITTYKSVSEGTYTLEVIADGKMLLKKHIGMGNDGKYSLCLYGLPVKNEPNNSATFKNRLHNIAEGEEANDPNALLPQLKILNDTYYGDPSKAKLRWVHAVPGAESITGNVISTETQDTLSLNELQYAEKSAFTTAKPGKKDVFWTLGSKKRTVAKTSLNLQAKNVYTFFILPQRDNYIDLLQVLITENE